MKKLASLLLAFALPAYAASHTATLTIQQSSDATTTAPGIVSIYQYNGACPTAVSSVTWTTLTTTFVVTPNSSGTGTGTYTATLPGPGTYCFYATATIGGATSGASNTGGGTATPFPPTITVVVQ